MCYVFALGFGKREEGGDAQEKVGAQLVRGRGDRSGFRSEFITLFANCSVSEKGRAEICGDVNG